MSNALIVVDVQNDFCEGGSLAVAGGSRVAQKIADMLDTGEHFYDLVVRTRDWHIDPGKHFSDTPDYIDSWPAHCRGGTRGAQTHPALANYEFDYDIYKGMWSAAYSGFEGKTLNNVRLSKLLREHDVTDVDVVGIAFDYCVAQTALDSSDNGFTTVVIKDLTASVNPKNDATVTKDLEYHYVRVV